LRRLKRRWTVASVVANVVGAVVVYAFLRAFHSAQLRVNEHHVQMGTEVFVVYLALGVIAGWAWRTWRSRRLWRWLSTDDSPSTIERDLILRTPLDDVVRQATLWAGAAVLFGALTISDSVSIGLEHAFTIVLGGVATCAITYLWIERLLRPVTARALAAAPPERPVGPGVSTRLIAAWALASGVPLLGLGVLAAASLAGEFQDMRLAAIAALVLVVAGIGAGALATVLAARSLADPVGSVRRALASVRAGRLDVKVAVDDGSEVGLLQAGFNEMAAGLRERERLRDLFGRHVGQEVARSALKRGVELGGEVREVVALFVDLVGSTALAARRPPEDVVSLLNRFFAIVVEVVEAHAGWINKFEGDAALCVFGPPGEDSDAASRALSAARALRSRLEREVPELDAGIGLSAGPAVAGNVGAERRFEYTIIGDPVNEAARLAELAKQRPGRLLASDDVRMRASETEAAHWQTAEEVQLRGRYARTRLLVPAPGPSR
jgi:adenylate cyclase